MTQDIQGVGRGAVPLRTGTTTNDRKDTPDPTATRGSGTAAGADRVSLTSTSETVRAAETTARNASGVDQARVDAIKTALAEGRYEVDAERLAERIVRDEQLLP